MIDRQRCLLFTNVYLFSVYVQFLAGEKDTCQWNKQNVWLQNWLYIKNNVINIKEINKIILKIRTFCIIKQKMLLLFSAKETDSSSTKLRHTVARSENWLREKSKGRISEFLKKLSQNVAT